MMDVYGEAIEKIIREQESIIGPLALEQAKKVSGLKFNLEKHQVDISGDKSAAIDKLVEQYKNLFGQTSVEVCKEAISGLRSQFPGGKVPSLLR